MLKIEEAQNFMEAIKDLAQRLIAIRIKLGLSQLEMANAIGVQRTTLAGYESGNPIRPMVIYVITEKLGVNPVWLGTGEGEMFLPGAQREFAKSIRLKAGRDVMGSININNHSTVGGDSQKEIEKLELALDSSKKEIEGLKLINEGLHREIAIRDKLIAYLEEGKKG